MSAERMSRVDQLKVYLQDAAENAGFGRDKLDKGLEHFAASLFAQEDDLDILEGEVWDSKQGQRIVQRYVCGGPSDGGFDVILHSEPAEFATVIQAKYSSKRIQEAQLEKVVDELIRSFLALKYKEERVKLSEQVRELVEDAELNRKATRVNLVVVTNQPIGDTQLQSYCARKELELKQAGRDVAVEIYGSSELLAKREQYQQIDSGVTVDALEIQLPKGNYFIYESGGARAVVALVKLSTVASWWKRYKNALFNLNVRSYLASSKLNKVIIATATSEPDNFSFYNNGITATCIKFEISSKHLLTATGAQIVNGAQTVKSVFVAEQEATDTERARLSSGTVMVRLIETGEKDGDKSDFAEQITRYQNTQNKVLESDFFSNDPIQIFLERELSRWSGHKNFVAPFWYERKRGIGRQANKAKITIKNLGSLRHAILHGPQVSYVEPKSLWDSDRVRYWQAFGVKKASDEGDESPSCECERWEPDEVARAVWAIHTWRYLRNLDDAELLSEGAPEKSYITYMASYIVSLTHIGVDFCLSQKSVSSYDEIMKSKENWATFTLPFLKHARLEVNQEIQKIRLDGKRSPLLIAGNPKTWELLRASMANWSKLSGWEKLGQR